ALIQASACAGRATAASMPAAICTLGSSSGPDASPENRAPAAVTSAQMCGSIRECMGILLSKSRVSKDQRPEDRRFEQLQGTGLARSRREGFRAAGEEVEEGPGGVGCLVPAPDPAGSRYENQGKVRGQLESLPEG